MCIRRSTDVGIWVPLHNKNHFLHTFIYTNFPVLTEHLKFTKTIPPRINRICFPKKNKRFPKFIFVNNYVFNDVTIYLLTYSMEQSPS